MGVQGHGITLKFIVQDAHPPVTPDGIQWFFEPVNGSVMELTPQSDSRYTFTDDKLSLYIYPLQLSEIILWVLLI